MTCCLSFVGASHLAKRLNTFWHDRGYPTASFWVEQIRNLPEAKLGADTLFTVRSNLVNGCRR